MARVIRARAELLPAPVVDARERAAALLADARAEAERLVLDARADADRVRREAEEAGRREALAQVAALETRVLAARARVIDEAEQAVVGLVTKIAERVLASALADAPERIIPAVRAQLERVRRARTVEIRVHPDDAATLRSALARGPLREGELPVTVTDDATLLRGGCVLKSDLGTIDARLEVQLAAFERALREAG